MSQLASARSYFDAQWNQRDASLFERMLTPDYASHHAMSDQFPPGREGDAVFTQAFTGGFPDLRCAITKQEEDGDAVKSWLTFTGTHQGELMGIPATGKPITVTVVATQKWRGNQICEAWFEWDPQDMLRQLGVAG